MRKFWEKPVCGIYKITHLDSGKCYIGQSVDVFKRWKGHSNLAVKKKSTIQNAFVLYGIDKFSFQVVEECDREMLNEREIYWIAYFNSVSPGGYNLTSGGGQGMTVSDETKEKMSASGKGKKHSEETLAKMSASLKGRIHSAEAKEKMSASHKGKKIRHHQVECPHCGKIGGISAMKRYHFENCKIYKELGVPKLCEEDIAEYTRIHFLPPPSLN